MTVVAVLMYMLMETKDPTGCSLKSENSHEGIVSEAKVGESLRIGQRSSWKPGQLGESKISVIFLAANLKLIGPFHGTLELGHIFGSKSQINWTLSWNP